MSAARRLRQIARLSAREWSDLALAAWELACANRKLAKDQAPPIRHHDLSEAAPSVTLTATEVHLIERIAWALPRAASVVPWRSDCLRQAEAGRRWLVRHGIIAQIRLGARKDASGAPEMHAWLMVAERVVTGGDIASYIPFGANAAAPR